MKDWLLAGAVYLTAWFVGRGLVSIGADPFITGWCVASIAVYLRWRCPGLRVTT